MTKDNAVKNSDDEARRGDEALGAARHLLSSGFYNDAVSRAYYAAFHWARALLVSRGIEAKTHRGVIQLFHHNFVRAGTVTEETAGHLSRLETYRELSDYTAFSHFTEAQAREEISLSETFINACRQLLQYERSEKN
ncbi:MAG: HEPN domain-containing protein [Kiritimatiellae bacterium]|nr:HEPN domain-containing protein [Kiritimatiellia bacterium]